MSIRMQPVKNSSQPVISQTNNNTTLWIGHLHPEPHDHLAGQTFRCPSDSEVNSIQLFSSSVHQPGEMSLSLHEFDPTLKTWGPAIGHSSHNFEKGDDGHWVSFRLDPVTLKKDAMYGFRLHSENALVGIGEAVSHAKQPFVFGHEWKASSKDQPGHYYSYFSLAFKVERCA